MSAVTTSDFRQLGRSPGRVPAREPCGRSLGDRDRPDGTRWSGSRFRATDRRSLIDAGAGYWRYIPSDAGVRFLTRYDYRPRWDRAGELVDRWVFRPVFAWATAWSFDRLRLWLEDGTPPERSRNQAVAHAIAVRGLARRTEANGEPLRGGPQRVSGAVRPVDAAGPSSPGNERRPKRAPLGGDGRAGR
jgi:hypothetical protein